MSGDTTADLKDFIERLRRGDQSARERCSIAFITGYAESPPRPCIKTFAGLRPITSWTALSTKPGRN